MSQCLINVSQEVVEDYSCQNDINSINHDRPVLEGFRLFVAYSTGIDIVLYSN